MKRISTIATIATLVALGAAAEAKTAVTVSYGYDQVFPAAVRFLRIDERLKIVERDAESGYIVFELEDDGETYEGYFEVARVRDAAGRDASRLQLRIDGRPEYTEQGLLDRFRLKLRRELGLPADPPPKKPAPKKPADEPGDKPKDGGQQHARLRAA